MKEVVLPITNIGRKYGYITWRKRHDADVQAIIGEGRTVKLRIRRGKVTERTIDWKRRRIGITYTFTRRLPNTLTHYVLSRAKGRAVTLSLR